ncbi:MAG: hypothetical protein KKA90_03840 [Nanoarchaeota archaeon]|nr:hypothetical protein [Nanoarchaeota archaeon]
MRVVGVFLTALVLSLVALPFASALDVVVAPRQATMAIGDFGTFVATISGNGADKYLINIEGKHKEWLTQSYILLNMKSQETRKINLGVYVSGDEVGTFPFTIRATSFTNPALKKGDTFTIDVFKRFAVDSIDMVREGTTLKVTTVIASTDPRTEDVLIELMSPDGVVLEDVIVPQVTAHGDTPVATTFSFDPYASPGRYSIRVSAPNTFKKEFFDVPVVEKIIRTVEEVNTPLEKKVIYRYENVGNVPADVVVEQTVHDRDLISGFAVNPTVCTATNAQGERDCVSAQNDVRPGQEVVFTYAIQKWPSVLQATLGGIMIVLAGTLLIYHQTRPRMRKGSRRKGKNRHHIVIEVRNPIGRRIKNVMVRDTVSPLAELDDTAYESVKPVVRKTPDGTELVWNLGDMAPRETRLLSYKVNTLVGGALKMPPARMRYVDSRDEKKYLKSQRVVVR